MKIDYIDDPQNDQYIMRATVPIEALSPSGADFINALTVALAQRRQSLNDWATEQLRQGRDVIEDEIETGIKRMRPLRPDDV